MVIRDYKLIQHSVLIHFQASARERNVCLRASEVKPKLDRFIIKKLGGRKEILSAHRDWVRSDNTNGIDLSLKYRMTIERADDDVTVYETKKSRDHTPDFILPALYYGNMGISQGDEKNKCGVFFGSGLKLRILCSDKALAEAIDRYIAEFFCVTNFGTMQSKGFGSFTVGAVDHEQALKYLKSNFGAGVCCFLDVGKKGNGSRAQNELFDTVKQVYSVMKSGQNHGGYIRSFIYVYMHNKLGLGNEKAYMKKTNVAPIRTTKAGRDDHEDKRQKGKSDGQYRYVRALLGIGDHIDWLENENEQEKGRRDKPLKETVTIADTAPEDKRIRRAASPVFFKIIGSRIYFTADQPDEKLYGRTFRFENTGYDKKSRRIAAAAAPREGNTADIGTLLPEEGKRLDMGDFLNEFTYYYNERIMQGKLRYKHRIEVKK